MEAPSNLKKQYELYRTYCDFGRRVIMSYVKNADQLLGIMEGRQICVGIKCRMKEYDDTIKKAKRKGYDLTLESIKHNITDIAGVRAIVLFEDDIYRMKKLLVDLSRFEVAEEIDYIKDPKPNGYKSLHLVIKVPVPTLSADYGVETKSVPVEVQIRTLAEELWGEAEHILYYKNDTPCPETPEEFKSMSDLLSQFDKTIVELRDGNAEPKKNPKKKT